MKKKKKTKNGKRTTKTTMKIGATGNNLRTKRGYVIPIRHTRATETQSDKTVEVRHMGKKKGKKQSKKKGDDR